MERKAPTKKAGRNNDLIKHFEVIAKAAEKCEGIVESVYPPDESLIPAQNFLGLNRTQTVLFAVIFILSFESDCVTIREIASHMSCDNIDMVRYYHDLDFIVRKKLIKEDRRRSLRYYERVPESYNNTSYVITRNVLEAILTSDKNLIAKMGKLDTIKFLEYVYNLIEEREEEEISTQGLCDEIHELFAANTELQLARTVRNLLLSPELQILLLYICRETLNGCETVDISRVCDKIFDDPSSRFRARRELIKGTSDLITMDLIELENGRFRGDEEAKLTEKAVHQFFDKELDIVSSLNKSDRFLITPDSITPNQLFFNAKENDQLKAVTQTLMPENFLKVRNRLKECNMREGMAILLHGPPGTGKSASVFDIAKKTGRNIMMVDISETKSMWFGESEKKIKQLFDQYRSSLKNEKIEPILLFNEIDAVFSTRKKVGSSSVDQTENAIQNIILQELEDLCGILIGTTNLTENLDPAFERRFLYKIIFSNPEADAREKIWKSKIPYLTHSEAASLGEKYEFTGGNIENIARKVTMDSVIYNQKAKLEDIHNHCENEFISTSTRRKLGFC
jgi:hypothetical protein